MAHKYGATIEAFHVLTPVIPEACPEAVHADEELAEAEMTKLQSSIVGVLCKAMMARGMSVWDVVEQAIRDHDIDLIVVGTHGHTGVSKLMPMRSIRRKRQGKAEFMNLEIRVRVLNQTRSARQFQHGGTQRSGQRQQGKLAIGASSDVCSMLPSILFRRV